MDITGATNGRAVFRRGALLLKLCAMLLALCAFSFAGVAKAYADDIGSITVDGETKTYSSVEDLANALKGYGGKDVTIDMLVDWNASYGKEKQFDHRLYIPEKCHVTFNMHGHIFDRDNVYTEDQDDKNGELIYVDNEATLIINGSTTFEESLVQHDRVHVFYGLEQTSTNNHFITVQGGCLTGGSGSCGTGGIYIDSGKDVTLNRVTIAGCKATYHWYDKPWHSGYGGGIIITEPKTKLKMHHCRITGCLAEEDGGGIYGADDDEVSIELDATSVDHNYANSDGGGINLDGEGVSISGKNGSAISANETYGYGGGVYFWNDNPTLSGSKQNESEFSIEGNRASRGGGVYVDGENNNLKKLFICNNTATDRGGGIYIGNDYTTIENCTITGNSGHGVFSEWGCDVGMYIKGSTVIKDNGSGNLTLESDSCNFDFDRNDGLDVHIGYQNLPSMTEGYQITPSICLDISNQLTADDEGYEVVYSYRDKKEDDGRRLRYIRKSDESDDTGHHRVNPDIEVIPTQGIHAYNNPTTVYSGGYTADEGGSGTTYQLRSIYAHHTSGGDKDYQTYYTDGFFFEDPVVYNDHLATASYGLATTGAYLDGYGYDYKHAGARQFMADIGCPDQMIYVNDNNTRKPGTDTIGVTIGSKVLQQYDGGTLKDTDYTLIAVAVRGANYEKEWASNVTLGDGSAHDGEAQGFSEAADQVMEAIEYYIYRYGLQDKIKDGKVKFWVAGFSRAGATSNLTSKRLVETYCADTGTETTVATGNQVFAYPCEAAKGGTDVAEKLSDKTAYYCIHNLVNAGDVVPLVGPKEMGFKRYGVDHYIPGNHIGRLTKDDYVASVTTSTYTPERASSESGVTSVTTYTDNYYLDTKKDMDSGQTASYREYADRRDNMVKHLAVIDHTLLFTDYFYPYGTGLDWPPFKKMGDFDGAKVEDFLPNFIAFLQQEACYNRDNYASIPPRGGQTVQAFARSFFGDDDTSKALTGIIGSIDKLYKDVLVDATVLAVLGVYYALPDGGKDTIISYLWNAADGDGVFNDLTSRQKEVLQRYWSTLADTGFNFADGDWDLGDYGQGTPVYPTGTAWVNGSVGVSASSGGSNTLFANLMIYSLTIYQNISMIIDINHSMEVCIAWTRTYDSYYSSDTSTGAMKESYVQYKSNWVTDKSNPNNYTVEAPDAYVKNSAPSATEKAENGNLSATGNSKPSANENNNPSATGNSNPSTVGAYKQLVATPEGEEPKYNDVDGGQRVLLEVGKIHDNASPAGVTQGDGDVFGEAVYYDLYDVSDGGSGEQLVKNQLYRGGVPLPSKPGGSVASSESGALTTHSYSQAEEEPEEESEGQSRQYVDVDDDQGYTLIAGQAQFESITPDLTAQDANLSAANAASGTGTGRVFKIVAHARSLGQSSDDATYYVVVGHRVTIDNGSGQDPVVSYYSSGDSAAIFAMPADDRYFTNWKVELLDGNGKTVEDDIAESILDNRQADMAVRFTMPEVGAEYETGKTYPDGYALNITAVCNYKISDITPSSRQGDNPLVPVAGDDKRVAQTADLTFKSGDDSWASPDNPYRISWSYHYDDKDYPTSNEDPIYGGCVYTATIVAPKDMANSIVFAAELTASPSPEMEGKVTSMTAVRDEADGSAIVTIVFNPTGDGPKPPAASNVLKLRGVDGSDPQTHTEELGECGYVYQNQTVSVTAKPWSGYKFVRWVFDDEYLEPDPYLEPVTGEDLNSRTIKVKIKNGVPTTDWNLCLYAEYEPVVTAMAAVVDAPVGGQPMQMKPVDEAGIETLKINFKGDWYVIHPDYVNTVDGEADTADSAANVTGSAADDAADGVDKVDNKGSIVWSPEPLFATDCRKANYLTSYTASLRIVPKKDGEISYIKVKKVESDAEGSGMEASSTEGSDSYIRVSAEFLYAENLKVTMNEDTAGYDPQNHTLSYTFPMTKYILKKVYAPEDVTGIPYGTVGDDLKPYLPLIEILLDDGRTMSTVAAWGEPREAFGPLDEYDLHVWMANGTVELPYGVDNPDNISLDVVAKLLVNEADSVKKPVPSVDPGTYLYDQELTLTSETEGATIYWTTDPDATNDIRQVPDDPRWQIYDGSMIAINRADAAEDEIGPGGIPTGRKLIRLKAAAFKDGMRPDGVRFYTYVFANEVPVPKGYDHEYNGAPQIGVHGSAYYTLEAISEGVTITKDGDAVATDPGTYTVKAKIADGFRWEIIDPETGETTYTTEDQIITFKISGFAITYDLNGGTYEGSPDEIVEFHAEGSEIEIHAAPVRDGYTFLYWKGSEYQPGDKYKVTEDHTFVAQWEQAPDPGPGPTPGPGPKPAPGPGTGDSMNLMLLLALALLALLSLAILRAASKRR